MLAIDGFLRGLWVGILALFVWMAISELVGWEWMSTVNWPVFLLFGITAGLDKIARQQK